MLPCMQELQRRHVSDYAACPMCGHGDESLYHCLITCDHAKLFWVEAEIVFAIKLPRLHPHTWATDLLDARLVPKKVAAIGITVSWLFGAAGTVSLTMKKDINQSDP